MRSNLVQPIEALEARLFLHAGSHAPAPTTDIAQLQILRRHGAEENDWHVSLNDLSSEERAILNPHFIEEPLDGPIDYDKLMGLPLRSGPEASDALPDFYPEMIGSASLDQTTQPGRNLLRFGTQVNNQGAGPASLISGNPGDPIPTGAPITSWIAPNGSQNVLQAVYTRTGNGFALSYYRAGGSFTYHTGHGHFHFDGYAYYRLRQRNANGTPGAYVTRADGSTVVGSKTGFCLLTFGGTFTTEAGQNSSLLPGFDQDTGVPSGCGLQQGVRVGRYDQYSSGLEGQWLDVTGVPNGQYFVEISLDGDDAILESNETNNSKSFAVTLNANPPTGGITPDVFDTGKHNDTFATASNMGMLGKFTQTGLNIDWGQDFDYFRFTASSTGTYSVSSTAANGNVDIFLFDEGFKQMGASTNASGTDTISGQFFAGQTYYLMAQAYNSTTSSNYQLQWNINPQVNTWTVTQVASAAGPAVFRVARMGPIDTPLNINLSYSGTGVSNVDYNPLPASITLGNLARTYDIPVSIKAGAVLSTNKTVILNISTNANYAIGVGSTVVTLLRNVQPRFELGGGSTLSTVPFQGFRFSGSLPTDPLIKPDEELLA